MVQVLFNTLGTCLSSSASFPVVSIFFMFEVPQGTWDILFNPLKTTADFHIFRNMGLIKYQDVGVGRDLLYALFHGDSSDVCHSLFSQRCCHLLDCSQGQLPTFANSFRSVQSFMGICSAFSQVEAFHLDDVFSQSPTVHLNKHISISKF